MDRGLYIAASGMLAEQARQNQIANDLANASTPGYKSESSSQESFGELLLQNTQTGQTIGTLGLGAQIAKTTLDTTPAPLTETGEPLDIGLQGQGFLRVQTPTGERYTRDGQLALDAQGQLETDSGYPVLDSQGRTITVGSSNRLTISPDGTLSRDGKTIATLGIVSLSNPVAQGNTLFNGTAGPRPATTTVEQGYLESSGVNATTEMVDMLTSLRNYQSDQQAVQSINQTMGEGIQAGGL